MKVLLIYLVHSNSLRETGYFLLKIITRIVREKIRLNRM